MEFLFDYESGEKIRVAATEEIKKSQRSEDGSFEERGRTFFVRFEEI